MLELLIFKRLTFEQIPFAGDERIFLHGWLILNVRLKGKEFSTQNPKISCKNIA